MKEVFRHRPLPALGKEAERQVVDEFRRVEIAFDQSAIIDRLDDLEDWDEAHDAAYNPHGKMTWKGDWAPGTYQIYDMAIDGSYVGVANKQTTDRLAPQDAGAAYNVYDGASPTSAITAKQLTVGQRYTWGQDGKLTGFRLYTVTGNLYRVFVIKDPLGDGIVNDVLSQFTADSTGWSDFPIDPIIVYAGTVFDLYTAMEEPNPTPTVWTANYNYTTPQNSTAPATGVAEQANSTLDIIRFNKTDNDATDRSAALLALTAGDVIDAVGMRWAIQAAPSDQGTYVEFVVAPAQQGAPDGVTAFTFETVVATPITIVNDVNFWLGDAKASGRYQIDGGSWVDTEAQYSIDIEVQPITISPDWDLLPQVGGGGDGSGGTFDHNLLTNRDAADQHPPAAITDLDSYIDARIAAADEAKWPVGSVFFSHEASSDPNDFLPGNWWNVSEGRFIIGAGTNGSYTYIPGEISGSGNETITLTEAQLPAHNHESSSGNPFVTNPASGGIEVATAPGMRLGGVNVTESIGGGQAHENRPPWFALMVWRRHS